MMGTYVLLWFMVTLVLLGFAYVCCCLVVAVHAK